MLIPFVEGTVQLNHCNQKHATGEYALSLTARVAMMNGLPSSAVGCGSQRQGKTLSFWLPYFSSKIRGSGRL